MSVPSVYPAMAAVGGELAQHGIAKSHINQVDDYCYRSIDDVLARLAPLLAKHKLLVLPRVLERIVTERQDDADRLLINVALKVEYALTSVEDGSSHSVEVYGEALDASDKASAKAMSAAYKAAIFQTFCIPVGGAEDPDRTTHRLSPKSHGPEPLQGWRQWCLDIEDIVALCESEQAIATVQERNRELLKALSREQPELYRELGQAFASRREVLGSRSKGAPSKRLRARPGGKGRASAAVEVEHA